nr:MAG TPA: nuclease [Caudoviricetes sp.]
MSIKDNGWRRTKDGRLYNINWIKDKNNIKQRVKESLENKSKFSKIKINIAKRLGKSEKNNLDKVRYSEIGKINDKWNLPFNIVNKDIILMEERKKHIQERHPEVTKYIKELPNIVTNPDQIYKENGRKDTIWMLKEYDKNIKIAIKINTEAKSNYKNSIIQMQYIETRRIINGMKSKKITKIFDKNNEV